MYETERLTLRQWRPADRDRALDIYSRWEVARWLGAEPRVLADEGAAEALIGRFRERSVNPPFGCWAVERRDTAVLVGTVLLAPIPDGDGAVTVMWSVTGCGAVGGALPRVVSPTRRARPCARRV
ncbi:GNAT family N-acetyltransferase [Kitasatospora sp. NPDC091276]|uniref:GNAT family N-acetyltransferase n=1 Tax=Kitasatospora sp. NPDC091276 TaxID=3155300 RepID=UPI00344A8F54